MVELEYGETPKLLVQFNQQNPNPTIDMFNHIDFKATKHSVKASLNALQGGLCVYCERNLKPDEGQLEHIKPKSKHSDLCFEYTNYAHSCCNNKTCGNKKKSGLLPIEPTKKECNAEWQIDSNDGKIIVMLIPELTKKRKHEIMQTYDMLGLNNAELSEERFKLVEIIKNICEEYPDEDPKELLQEYLKELPFRYIFKNYFD
ncbi:MAG: hypothetical protein RI956_216 [Pseudomonadota bacterium]|jgi:uncharacterized protein (TIGR02646 family)